MPIKIATEYTVIIIIVYRALLISIFEFIVSLNLLNKYKFTN